jgi:HD-like signal output (HDOD) protein
MDPVLSCAVIQTANSPYFRRAASVATVPHAMVIVGIKHVQEIVGNAIESSKDVQVFGGNEEIAASFWKHAVVVARITELLKDVIQVNPSTDMHLAGLLHDLGMLALDGLSPNFYGHAGSAPELEDLVKAEKEYVGVDHGQAGAWLGEFLGLPHVYLDVMRYHHSPEKVSSTSALPVALVTLANLFATERGICLSKPKLEQEALPRSFAWVLIQEQHKPFLDVNIMQFIDAFNLELDKSWTAITADMP